MRTLGFVLVYVVLCVLYVLLPRVLQGTAFGAMTALFLTAIHAKDETK